MQVFENRGAMTGASNPHPHGQIWTSEWVPNEPAKQLAQQRAHARSGGCLLCDYLDVELDDSERVVTGNEHVTALVPFWAVRPFESPVPPVPTPAPCPSSAPTGGTGWPTPSGA